MHPQESNVFYRLFPNSRITKSMQLGKDNIKYNITYGLSVHFADDLKKTTIKSSILFSVFWWVPLQNYSVWTNGYTCAFLEGYSFGF